MNPNRNAVSIPEGMSVRAPTFDDVPAIAELQNAVFIAELGHPDTDPDELRREWAEPTLDLSTDAWVVLDADGSPVAQSVLYRDNPDAVEMDGYVHPEREGEGLGSLILRLAEARAAEMLAEAPTPGVDGTIDHGLWTSATTAARFLESHGFAVVRYFLRMRIEFDGPYEAASPPSPLVIRTISDGEERAVFEASEEAFRDHWEHTPTTFELWEARRITGDASYDPSLWFLAMDGDEVAGQAICRGPSALNPDGAWVVDLSVRRPWRGRGVGFSLLTTALATFQARGWPSAALSVDAESPVGAVRLYEKAGMSAVEQIAAYRKVLRPASS